MQPITAFGNNGKKEGSSIPTPILVAYLLFLVSGVSLYVMVGQSEDAFAAVFTVATMLQCLAMVLLVAQVLCTGSVSSISGRAVLLEAVSLVCRLISTCSYNGYLPMDKSGDHLFQSVDVCTLVVSLWLLYQIYVTKHETYMKNEDSFPVIVLTIACFVLAVGLHGNNNLRPFFDTMWLAGLNLGTVSVLPQLSLIKRIGGRVATLTSHNIAIMAVGRTLAAYFLWLAREDIECKPYPWAHGVNHAKYAILGASFLHVLLVAKFAYIYVKALLSQGLMSEGLYLDCGDASKCELARLKLKEPPSAV
jgi:hypothetical protein